MIKEIAVIARNELALYTDKEELHLRGKEWVKYLNLINKFLSGAAPTPPYFDENNKVIC
jgi:hypothetical protein